MAAVSKLFFLLVGQAAIPFSKVFLIALPILAPCFLCSEKIKINQPFPENWFWLQLRYQEIKTVERDAKIFR